MTNRKLFAAGLPALLLAVSPSGAQSPASISENDPVIVYTPGGGLVKLTSSDAGAAYAAEYQSELLKQPGVYVYADGEILKAMSGGPRLILLGVVRLNAGRIWLGTRAFSGAVRRSPLAIGIAVAILALVAAVIIRRRKHGAISGQQRSETPSQNVPSARGSPTQAPTTSGGKLTCAKCGRQSGDTIAGFGQCPQCHQIWCSNCYPRGTGEAFPGVMIMANLCPNCRKVLKPPAVP